MHWSEKYIGKPYCDANCAELAAIVLRNEFDHHLELPGVDSDNVFALSEQISNHRGDYAERTVNPQEGDAVLMRSMGRLNHVGVYCVIDGHAWVLHAVRNAGQTCLHRLPDLARFNITIEGFYRWL
jgi:hypothetical protein